MFLLHHAQIKPNITKELVKSKTFSVGNGFFDDKRFSRHVFIFWHFFWHDAAKSTQQNQELSLRRGHVNRLNIYIKLNENKLVSR